MFKFKRIIRIISILLIGFITAFATGCPGGCQNEPLTAEQELVAKEMAKAKSGDFIVTDSGIYFITRVNVGASGLTVIAMDYCPGVPANAKSPEQIATWTSSPRLVPSGSERYLAALGEWIRENPQCD
ncbi:MAG: hypothetical protein WC030_02395 [Candidatus Paceibacterota bacterium]